MNKIYYKVVRLINGTMMSVTTGRPVVYKEGEVTCPGIGSVFIFKDLKSANTFVNINCFDVFGDCQVWECEASRPRPMKFMLRIHLIQYTELLQDFWSKGKQRKRMGNQVGIVPHGTMVADYIKMIRRVR